MRKNITEFVLENGDVVIAIFFFFITLIIFIVAAVHVFKMKRSTLDEIANLAIKPDNDKKNGSE